MTEYTWDKKTGKVKSKGKGKKPIDLKKVAISLLPFKNVIKTKKFAEKVRKKRKKAKTLEKKEKTGQTGGPAGGGGYYTDALTPDRSQDKQPDRPKAVWVSKGGSVKLAKKYFKGGMV